jgi:hypothetical protein
MVRTTFEPFLEARVVTVLEGILIPSTPPFSVGFEPVNAGEALIHGAL